MKKIIFLVCLFSSFVCCVKAECTYSEISRLKGFASNINISYEHKIVDQNACFNVTINNLTPDLYVVDNFTNKNYFYSDSNNGELMINDCIDISNNKYIVYASTPNCLGKRLLSKYISFPKYNIYYGLDECDGIHNFYLCKKWVPEGTSFSKFHEQVEEYKNSKKTVEDDIKEEKIIIEKSLLDKILDFYAKYYYYILVPITLISLIVILYQRKKDNIKL